MPLTVESLPQSELPAGAPAWVGPRALWPWEPANLGELARVAASLDQAPLPWPRDAVRARLRAGGEAIGADAASLANLARLSDPRALVVVTGQQAGLWSGPLYTVLKAFGAIRLARLAEARLGRPVLPIFWLASEDHDLSEIASASFPDKTWQAAYANEGIAAEALPVAPAQAVTEEWLASVIDPSRRAELAALFPASAPDYGAWNAAFLARLFAGTGLVILEPRWLRPLAGEFFAQVLTGQAALRRALADGAERLRSAGVEPSFTAGEGLGLFHLDEQGRRRQIQLSDSRCQVAGRDWLSPEELLVRLRHHPEQFSPAAWLRPVLQGKLLPTLAYVAGPGEWRYHLQLPGVFAALGVPPPLLRARPHATLISPREERLLQQLALSPADWARGPQAAYRAVDLPAAQAAAFGESEAAMQAALATLAAQLGPLLDDASLARVRSRLGEELEKLRTKATREFRRQGEVDNARVDRLFAVLRPRQQPQERVLNILYFIEREGLGLLADLLAALDPEDESHRLIRLGDAPIPATRSAP